MAWDGTAMTDDTFLAEVRSFLASALTEDLREAGRRTLGVHSDIASSRLWHSRLYERGWIAPAWPKAWGGAGWTPRQRFLFDRECARNDAPVLFASGIRALGPLLIEQGTPEQQRRFIPPILAGEDLWCQGFSEPGAGSDLAAVSCRAERHGDDYVINGSKIWTTGAHLANRMFAIVRTGAGERPQQGLTFLLLDMESPGLTVSPIFDLAGEHEFNQVFFEGVRTPVANRVGAEGEGWAVAKRLMQLARSNNTPAALVRRSWRRAAERVAALGEDWAWRRLAELEIDLETYEMAELRAVSGAGAADSRNSSVLKLLGTELHQKVAELAMLAAGPQAAAHGHDLPADLTPAAEATARHLLLRAATIYSGTSEIHHNVLAGQMLNG